jgi:acyl-CoA reductase-like NAD-dependent aldehyde dehydrogenase
MPSDPKEDAMARESTVSELSIAGERVTGPEILEVRSPFTDEVVGRVPTVGAEAVTAAVDGAAKAMSTGLPAHRRAEILDRVAADLERRRDEFARLLAAEVAKPLGPAAVEVDRAVQTLRFSAVEARSLAGDVIAMDAHPSGGGRMGWTLRVPTGVIAAITPFNFPLNLAAHKVGPAIAAGCGVVVKPPRTAPLTAVALADAFYDAGLPREWMSVVVGPSGPIGDAFISDSRVSVITFTGSSEVGWDIAARAPRKHVALELGNSTPVIVCADADLDRAATTLAGSAFGFAGQSCISVQRLIVHEAVKDQFAELLLKETAAKKAGDPVEPGIDLGPLIDEDATERVLSWVDEATHEGAELLAGGTRDGKLVLPTVIDNASAESSVWQDEVFGPVVSLRTFADVDEAVALANGTDYGLQAGIYTSNIGVALAAATKLDFGGVTINETPTFRVDQMPYGGTKESGNTREGPHYTVRAMTEERMIVIGL